MKTTQSWIIAGTLGIFVGAAGMHFMSSDNSKSAGLNRNSQYAKLLTRIDQMQSTLDALRNNDTAPTAQSSGFSNTQESTQISSNRNTLQATQNKTSYATSSINTTNQSTTEQDEETTQVIDAQLQNPDYTNDKTLPDLIQSAEMSKLSPKAREKEVSKIVGMINRGEISVKSFGPNSNTSQ